MVVISGSYLGQTISVHILSHYVSENRFNIILSLVITLEAKYLRAWDT
jgi:hypothetical protein